MAGCVFKGSARDDSQVVHLDIWALWIIVRVGGQIGHVVVDLGLDCLPDFDVRIPPGHYAYTSDFQYKALPRLPEHRCPCVVVGPTYRRRGSLRCTARRGPPRPATLHPDKASTVERHRDSRCREYAIPNTDFHISCLCSRRLPNVRNTLSSRTGSREGPSVQIPRHTARVSDAFLPSHVREFARCVVRREGRRRSTQHYDGVLRVDVLCARQLLQASQTTSAYERLPPRSRAAKRLLWIDRSWWRDEAGCAYLRADGYGRSGHIGSATGAAHRGRGDAGDPTAPGGPTTCLPACDLADAAAVESPADRLARSLDRAWRRSATGRRRCSRSALMTTSRSRSARALSRSAMALSKRWVSASMVTLRPSRSLAVSWAIWLSV